MSDNKTILVYAETDDNGMSSVTFELLGIGRKLADAVQGNLAAVIIDRNAGDMAQDVISGGADLVYTVNDAPTEYYEGASYTSIIEGVCLNNAKPAVILFGQTLTGRDLAPRIAFRLKAGLVTDCTEISIDSGTGSLKASKPVSGGNVIAQYTVKSGAVQVASVRRKTMEPLAADESRSGEITPVPARIDSSAVKAKRIERCKEETEGPNIESADIIVAGGRGVGSVEEFATHIKGLAGVLDAGIGATRAAVDSGLISEQHQVGLTGKIVGPSAYFAIALSGAIQHMAGCAGSKNIIAINRDENAQIFKFAKYGIVADYKKVLPALIEKLK